MPYGLKLKYMVNSTNKNETIKCYDDMLTRSNEHRPILNDENELIYLEYDSSAHSGGVAIENAENLKILFDKELMFEHLNNCGLKDVISYKITVENLYHDRREYVVVIYAENDIYFMPVLENGDTVGRFEHLNVYTREEMKERLEMQPIEIIVMGEKLVTDETAYMEYGTYYVPFRAMCEKLGYAVDWDGANSRVTISKNSEHFELFLKPFDNFHYALEMNIKYPDGDGYYIHQVGFCTISNSRIMVTEFGCLLSEIEPELEIIESNGTIKVFEKTNNTDKG